MDNSELAHLTLQVESLLLVYDKLKNENLLLKQKLKKTIQERADLIDRNKRAACKIKRIISHLRDELQ